MCGVKPAVMALMASESAFGRVPDYAIFADTGWEPPSVYDHIQWLAAQLYVVDNGRSLREKPKNPLNRRSSQTSLELCTPVVVSYVGIEVYPMGLCLHQFLVFKLRNVEILINRTSTELYL